MDHAEVTFGFLKNVSAWMRFEAEKNLQERAGRGRAAWQVK
jgi:hypothetical protein